MQDDVRKMNSNLMSCEMLKLSIIDVSHHYLISLKFDMQIKCNFYQLFKFDRKSIRYIYELE